MEKKNYKTRIVKFVMKKNIMVEPYRSLTIETEVVLDPKQPIRQALSNANDFLEHELQRFKAKHQETRRRNNEISMERRF